MILKQYLIFAILKCFSAQPMPYEFKKHSPMKWSELTSELTPVLEQGIPTPLSQLQATCSCHLLLTQ